MALIWSSSIFVPIYLNIILPDTQKLLRPLDRKTAVISLTKTLTQSNAFAEKYKKGWAFSCEALLKLLENPPIPPATDDIIAEQDPDDMSFGVGFTQLTTIKRPPRDHWPEISDVKKWVSECLRTADGRTNVSAVANKQITWLRVLYFGQLPNRMLTQASRGKLRPMRRSACHLKLLLS